MDKFSLKELQVIGFALTSVISDIDAGITSRNAGWSPEAIKNLNEVSENATAALNKVDAMVVEYNLIEILSDEDRKLLDILTKNPFR